MPDFMANLTALTDRSRDRYAQQKGAAPSRLQVKAAKTKDEKRLWAEANRYVWTRDGAKDRHTKRRVFKTLALDPKRGEVHHVVSRDDQAVRFDRRNLILLSLETHEKVERNALRIVGTAWFTVNGKRYIDADAPVRFVKVGAVA